MAHPDRSPAPIIGRRRLLAGGAGALAAGAVIAEQPAAATPPAHVQRNDVASRSGVPHALLRDAVDADLVSGLTYRTASMYDFSPFAATGQRQWGGQGVYSANTPGAMRATVVPPPGARLHAVVFYVYNNSAGTVTGDVLKFTAGNGNLTQIANVNIPATAGMSIVRAPVLPAQAGPYPVGTVLLASVTTPTDGKVQVNAARFGFANGAGTTGLLPRPIRVYDSRHTRKLRKGSTRTITLPERLVAPGTIGVLLNVTARTAAKPGFLKVYRGDATRPASPTSYFLERPVTSALTVGIGPGRQIKVFTNRSVHVVVDLVGTVA